MAYLDFSEVAAAGVVTAPAFSPARATTTGFSALEWLVIALAERDRKASLATPGRIATALHRLFGAGGRQRLANPGLEALRRFAVLAWHDGGNVAPSEYEAFRAAGFSARQADTLLESIFARRGGRRVGAA